MAEAQSATAPAWQTEELQEEWVDLDPEESSVDNDNLTYGTRSISLTIPLTTHIHTNNDHESAVRSTNVSPAPVGTFLVREDLPTVPVLPKTPGRNKKGLMKDFFSPLPLQQMFVPPSPPTSSAAVVQLSSAAGPVRPSWTGPTEDEIIETDVPDMGSFHGRKASLACQFTFSVPKQRSLNPNNVAFPQAQSTPSPPFAPNEPAVTTDPRLRLFQFHYDTYTRDHLSAMVDSIAINTPGTGTTPSPPNFSHGLSRVSEVTNSAASVSDLRSTKRVKLSPRSDFYAESMGVGASIARPKSAKDYLGESRNLMQQIKQAQDFSTISTIGSAQYSLPVPDNEGDGHRSDKRHSLDPTPQPPQRASYLAVPNAANSGTAVSRSGSSSSSLYREQAVALMAQIRSDVKGQKRLFSEETEVSYVAHLEDKANSFTRSSSPKIVSASSHPYPLENKENQRQQPSNHSRTPSTKSHTPRHKGSTRKSVTNAGAFHGADGLLVDELSKLRIQDYRSHSVAPAQPLAETRVTIQTARTTHLAVASNLPPPSYPSSSLRIGQNEDLYRFVSSSTASGTTLTAGSVPSFVKHPGPAHIRTIAPTDLPQLPDKLGDMQFDKVMMKWVKTTARATGTGREMDGYIPTEEASEDPFGDIESLRDDSRGGEVPSYQAEKHEPQADMSRIDERSELDDDEEMELISFSTDNPSALVVDVMTGIDDDETTDSEDDGPHLTITQIDEVDYYSEDAQQQSMSQGGEPSPPVPPSVALPPARAFVTPHRGLPVASATPVVRSAMKSHSATPTSALKDPSRVRNQTPYHSKRHRRSVSFSDGRKDGPIHGLVDTTGEEDEAASMVSGASGIIPSARSRRIAQMMHELEDSDSDGSPSKASSRPEALQSLPTQRPSSPKAGDSSQRMFSRSRTHKPSSTGNGYHANATFLTECSFGVAHDRLVEVITDVQPFSPHWDELSSIDLSNKRLESVARLKEFLPRLDALSLNENQLAWLSGVPGTVRTLSVASNCLTRITSYSHLLNLENLDISRNDVESLTQLACLRHLRELKADGNKISNADGLQRIDSLVKLSLQGNALRSIDLTQFRWKRLEMLNMSQNRLDNIRGLSSLQALVALNLDNNELEELALDGNMPKLRILRVSGNRLHQLRVATTPNVRTLYADNNALSSLVKVDRLRKLENLSLRNQSGKGLNLLTRDARDVKRLYLSGNPLKAGFLTEPCYNLVYLELAACRLTRLPEDLSKLVPNLRVLNLNYNFLEDARPLEGLTRLRKLTIIGSRLKGTKALIRLLQRMVDVEMLDFRMNPCTLGWYLPLLVRDVPGALQPSEGNADGRGERAGGYAWHELDSKFRRDLPDESYIGRLAYRGLIMRACPLLRMLDGVEVTGKERIKAQDLLEGIIGKDKKPKGKGKTAG